MRNTTEEEEASKDPAEVTTEAEAGEAREVEEEDVEAEAATIKKPTRDQERKITKPKAKLEQSKQLLLHPERTMKDKKYDGKTRAKGKDN